MTIEFCQRDGLAQEYRQAYLIMDALTKETLIHLRTEIQEFQFSEVQPYLDYWLTMDEICLIEIEKRTVGVESLSPHKQIEDAANSLLSSLNDTELQKLEKEVR